MNIEKVINGYLVTNPNTSQEVCKTLAEEMNEITVEFAESIGLMPKVNTVVKTGKLFIFDTSRRITNREYMQRQAAIYKKFNVSENLTVRFPHRRILEKINGLD